MQVNLDIQSKDNFLRIIRTIPSVLVIVQQVTKWLWPGKTLIAKGIFKKY